MNHWLHHIGLLILLVLSCNILLRHAFNRMKRKKTIALSPKLSILINAFSLPIRIYLWVTLLLYALHRLLFAVLKSHFAEFTQIVSLTSLILVIWTSLRLIKNIEVYYISQLPDEKNRSFSISAIKAFSHLAFIGVLVIAALILLSMLHIPISGLLTFGGVSGLALAYAGKNIFSSFTGGIMLYVNRQFSIGDWIRSPDRDIEGIVESMGWSTTTIRRLDKQIMYVSNAIFNGLIIINASRMSHRFIHQVIHIRYDDIEKIPGILSQIKTYIENHPNIDLNAGVKVNLTEFSATSVNFQIDVYTHQTDLASYLATQDDILMKAFSIISACGASCNTAATTQISLHPTSDQVALNKS